MPLHPIRVGVDRQCTGALRVRTSSGYINILVSQIGGASVGALRDYLEKLFPSDVVRLSGQRVTHFRQNESVTAVVKRAKMGTNSSVLLVVEGLGKGGWDPSALDSYSLVALTEKEAALMDDASLSWYINGAARYHFGVLRAEDHKLEQIEMYVMVHSNSRLQLLVSPDWTIRRIKSEISQCTGIPTYAQRLFTKTSAGDLLPDYKTVMDCGFTAKTCIELTVAASSPTFKGGRAGRSVHLLGDVTRPFDVRIRIPSANRVVAVKCDKTDTCEAVKARLATRLDPRSHKLIIARSPSCGSPSTPEQEDIDEDDPNRYLEQCLRTLSLEHLPCNADDEEADLQQLGLSAQEVMVALRESRAQVKALQAELQLCKGAHARKMSRKMEGSQSAVKGR